MAGSRLGMVFLALGMGAAGYGTWVWGLDQCMQSNVTLSTRSRCFAVVASPIIRSMPLPGCMGGRAIYRAAEWDDDQPAWESLECLTEEERGEIEAELSDYLDTHGFEAFPSQPGWARDDRHVHLKMLGVIGAPTALQITVEETGAD